ncbi:MAG: hypothetical protein JO015_08680 [Verrucomicrobia bacterium]|nr:hypothetical protein [Verrucomicrobiota bacterium]
MFHSISVKTVPVLLALTWAGCRSEPEAALVAGRYVTGPPPEFVSGTHPLPTRPAPFGSLSSVRQPEEVKVYGVNRYVDPADSRVLHERHAIYRIERPSGWVARQPDHHGEILLGPVLGLRRAEYRPEPIPGETAQALVQQRRTLEETTAGIQNVQENQRRLSASVERLAAQSAEAQQKLTAIVSVLNGRLKRLENGEEPGRPEASAEDMGPPQPATVSHSVRGPE